MYWLNVDIVTKTNTIHSADCHHMQGRKKRSSDGGWTLFDTLAAAREAAKVNIKHTVKECRHCLRE
ncbi:hypothetical protein [Paenibacillus sp. CAU 1782]